MHVMPGSISTLSDDSKEPAGIAQRNADAIGVVMELEAQTMHSAAASPARGAMLFADNGEVRFRLGEPLELGSSRAGGVIVE